MSNAQQNIIDNQAFDIYKQEKLAKLFILIHTIFGFILFQGCLVNKKVLEVLGDKYCLIQQLMEMIPSLNFPLIGFRNPTGSELGRASPKAHHLY